MGLVWSELGETWSKTSGAEMIINIVVKNKFSHDCFPEQCYCWQSCHKRQQVCLMLISDFLAALGFILLLPVLTMWLPVVMWLPSKARDNRKNPYLN